MSTNLRNPADRRDYPARWTMRRGKELFREIDERSADGSEELLSVSHITGITPRSQKNVTMFQSESLVGYKICRPGDIAANTMWTWQGAIGVSDYFGVISPSYNVYRQRQDTYNPRYLDFLLREPKLVDVYYSLSTGIRPSRRRLYPDEFLTIRFPVPPRAEQDKIVRFLDEKANAIGEVIATRQKQIDELHELRKTIINRAVTRGISRAEREGACPHAPSDARRLGTAALPNGWKMVKIKAIFDIFSGATPASTNPLFWDGDIVWITPADYKTEDHFIYRGARNISSNGYNSCSTKLIPPGSLVFSKRAPVGTIAISKVPLCTNQGCLSCVPHKNACSEFYYYVMWQLEDEFDASAGGTTFKELSLTAFRNFPIPLPPVDEQREIAAYLDEKCAAIDKAIENRKAAIEELVALKARIVADAVTGRMEVE